MVKIIRKWVTTDKRFTLGQDIMGNLYAKCNECNIDCNIGLTFLNHKKSISFQCPDCKRKFKAQ